jgi:hypothetical protein
MRTETRTHIFRTFSELTKENQLKLVANNRDMEVQDDWWEYVYTDAMEVGTCLGLEIREIQFSGFWSQGDGARFRGLYTPRRDMVEAVKAYAPVDKELHAIAESLAEVQERYDWTLGCEITFSNYGNCVHEYCTSFEFSEIGRDVDGEQLWATEEDEKAVTADLRRFMSWIYRRLEKEYEYLTSDEHLLEVFLDQDDEYEVEIVDGEEELVRR